jgi:hypothetical protein
LAFIKLENLDVTVDALAEYLDEKFQNVLKWCKNHNIGKINRMVEK